MCAVITTPEGVEIQTQQELLQILDLKTLETLTRFPFAADLCLCNFNFNKLADYKNWKLITGSYDFDMRYRKHTAFISGHGDITQEEFELHYQNAIDQAIQNGDAFIVGDYHGLDTIALYYLKEKQVQDVTLCHMFKKPAVNPNIKKIYGNFESHEERDAFMTENSDYDIAWVRPGKLNSGTESNLKRRKK